MKYIFILLLSICPFFLVAQSAEDNSISYSYIGEGKGEGNAKIAFQKIAIKQTFDKRFSKTGKLFFQNIAYASVNVNYSEKLDIPTELEQFHFLSYKKY